MQVFNSFDELFNASCLSASAYFGSRCFDEEPVRMNDGLADISEFLAIDNKTTDSRYKTRKSGYDNSEAFDEHELLVVSEELGGEYWDLFSNLRDDINEIGLKLFGEKKFKPIMTINMRALDDALNRIDKTLLNFDVSDNFDTGFYKEYLGVLRNQAKELRKNAVKKWNEFKGTFYNITGYPEDQQRIWEKLRYFEKNLAEAKNPQECAEVFFSLLDDVLVYDEKSNMWFSNVKPDKNKLVKTKGNTDSGIEKDFIKVLESGKSLTEREFDRLFKKLAKSEMQLGKLYTALRQYGFGWTLEEHWINDKFPVELVTCANMLFGNHFGKIFWQYFARAWQTKYESADKLDELFDKYGDKVKNLFGTLDASYDKNAGKSKGQEDLEKAFWSFICDGDPDHIVIIQHLLNRTNAEKTKYKYWKEGELDPKYVYPDNPIGNDEVDRLLYLFDCFSNPDSKNKYIPLKINK